MLDHYCDCETPVLLKDSPYLICDDCGGVVRDAPERPFDKLSTPPSPKPIPQPDQRICIKCGGTEHKLYYVRAGSTIPQTMRCEPLKCPDHEHMHVVCCDCGYDHWQHCADHVEVPAPPQKCVTCGEKFDWIAGTQSSRLGLCSSCWLEHVKLARESGDGK